MIMSKWNKRLFNAVLIATLVFAFNIIAFAQGTTKIAVSKSSASVGDKITVSVSGTEKGTITVKYTSSMLNLTSCNASGYSTEGNAVSFSGKSGDLVFNAVSEGTASIIVSSSANSGSSTTLSIGGGAAAETAPAEPAAEPEEAAPEEPAEEAPAEQPAEAASAVTPANGSVGTLNGDGGFDINGVAYVVSERYADSEIPSGFSKTTITIGSSTYNELTNGAITLIYLKPADNTAGSGVFYLYNADAGTVSPFLMLGSAKNYVIISNPDAPISSAFTEASIEVTGGTATAYTLDGAEFFYVYGVNQDGATGWYLYDKTYGTVSRVDEAALSAAGDAGADDADAVSNSNDSELYIEKLNLYRKIIMGLIILCVVLLFIIINKAVKGHGEDDDDFDGDVFAEAPKKNAKRLPRSIVFGSRNQDDEEEDYEESEESDEDEDYEDDIDEDTEEEEYYDDEDEEEYYDEPEASRVRYESESYEARRASSLNMMDLNDL